MFSLKNVQNVQILLAIFEKKIQAFPFKLAKIIGVLEVHFFSKVDSNRFFTTSKYAQIYFFFTKLVMSENGQK